MTGLRPHLRYLPWLAVPAFLVWIARTVQLDQAIAILGRLEGRDVLVLACANALVLLLFSARWWLILRALGHPVSYLALAGYRLCAYAVGYFTPGPQFGGEPLQVYLVEKRHAVPRSTALAALALDKLFELLANFAFLAIGLALTFQMGLFPSLPARPALLAAAGLAALPLALLLAVAASRQPLSTLLAQGDRLPLPPSWCQHLVSAAEQAREGERQAASFFQNHPGAVVYTIGLSAVTWAGLVLEYRLALQLLEISLSAEQAVVALTAARVALLAALPAGLGALEASQVLILGQLGVGPAAGVSLSLLIRARDLILGGIGLSFLATYAKLAPASIRPPRSRRHQAAGKRRGGHQR